MPALFKKRPSVAPTVIVGTIGVPGQSAGEGSKARVVQRLGDRGTVERPGRVIRLVGELDPESRTAQVLVEVERPFDPPPGELPLLPGAFVEVELEGQEPLPVVPVPRLAVVEGHHTWVVDGEQRLRKRQLQIAWGDDARIYASAGLSAGDRVVVTPPPTALEGMEVRSEEHRAATPQVSAAGSEAANAEG